MTSYEKAELISYMRAAADQLAEAEDWIEDVNVRSRITEAIKELSSLEAFVERQAVEEEEEEEPEDET